MGKIAKKSTQITTNYAFYNLSTTFTRSSKIRIKLTRR